MSAINDGGPAFPGGHVIEKNSDHYGEPYWDGMSLRDYFAGQALHAASDSVCDDLSDPGRADHAPEHAARHARAAYLLADAMLAERERSNAK